MKPLTVSLVAASLAVGVPALALRGSLTPIRLPVYEKPVTFFSEKQQGLDLGPLPAGIKSLSGEGCVECHRGEHAEWKNSAHARSVTEPVFAAAFQSEPRFLCRSCHSPLLQQHPVLNPALTTGLQPTAPAAPASGPAPPEATRVLTGETPPSATVPGGPEEEQVQRRLEAVGGVANPHYSEALMKEGVTCSTCHVREGTILSSRPTVGRKAPHVLSYSPMLGKAELCAGCHQFEVRNPRQHAFERAPVLVQQLARPAKQAAPQAAASTEDANTEEPPVPSQPSLHSQCQQEPRVQDTLQEFHLSATAAQGGSCNGCHMPAVKGKASHTWPGRESVAMLQKALSLTARLDRPAYRPGDQLQAVIKLKNDSAHRFPTGDSIHAGLLDVWLRDGQKTLGRQVFVMSGPSGLPVLLTQVRHARGGFSGGRESGLALDFVEPQPGGLQAGGQLLTNGLMVGGLSQGSVAPGGRGRSARGERLESAGRADTRLLPGEEQMLVYRQKVTGELAKAKQPVLRLRVFHAAIHPGFKGTDIDPKLSPPRLVREQVLPVRLEAAPPKLPEAASPQ